MKNTLIKYFILVFFSLAFLNNSCKSSHKTREFGNLHDAIIRSIDDFKSQRGTLFKSDSVFFIINEEDTDYFRITIIGDDEDKYLYSPAKNPQENRIPNNYLEFNNKLFIWYDSNREITKQTIEIYKKFDLLIDDEEGSIKFLDNDILDDKKKGTTYFFCKNDLSKFKKIISSFSRKYKVQLKCD